MIGHDPLLQIAMDAFKQQARAINARGERLDDSCVFAFFDGRNPPGINLATAELQAQTGLPQGEARRRVDQQVQEATARGQLFALGTMLPPETLISILRNGARDEVIRGHLDRLAEWLAAPVPPKHYRCVVIDESRTEPYLIELLPAAPATKAESPN
jgi:hypothetical protein